MDGPHNMVSQHGISGSSKSLKRCVFDGSKVRRESGKALFAVLTEREVKENEGLCGYTVFGVTNLSQERTPGSGR